MAIPRPRDSPVLCGMTAALAWLALIGLALGLLSAL